MNLSELLKDNEDILYTSAPTNLTITNGKILYLRFEGTIDATITFENGTTKKITDTISTGYPVTLMFGVIDYVPLYRNFPSSSDEYQEYNFRFFSDVVPTNRFIKNWGAKSFLYNFNKFTYKDTQYYYSLQPLKIKSMTITSNKSEIIYIKSIY